MRVLALDLSYVMAPSISRYGTVPTSKHVDIEKHWDCVRETLDITRFRFSLERLSEMTKSFSKALKNVDKDQVHLVQYQSDMLPTLILEDHLVIHNIDHFHDFLSGPYSGGLGIQDDGWIAELDRLKLVDEYIWWRNRNSGGLDECFSCNCSYQEVVFAKRQPMKKSGFDSWSLVLLMSFLRKLNVYLGFLRT